MEATHLQAAATAMQVAAVVAAAACLPGSLRYRQRRRSHLLAVMVMSPTCCRFSTTTISWPLV